MSVVSSNEDDGNAASEKIGSKSIYQNNWNKILDDKTPIAVEDVTDFIEKIENKKFSLFIGSFLIIMIFYAMKPSFVTRQKISKYDNVEIDSVKFFFATCITISSLFAILSR